MSAPRSGGCAGLGIDRPAAHQVGAGTEAAAGAGQQHGADVVVVAGARQLAVHRLDQGIVHGVQPLGTVERQGEHAAFERGEDRCFFHMTVRLA